MADGQGAKREVMRPRRGRLFEALDVVLDHRGFLRETWPYLDALMVERDGVRIDALPEALGWRPRWAITDPAAAWEALASEGLVPFDAVGDEGRAFECAACDGRSWHPQYTHDPTGVGGPFDCKSCGPYGLSGTLPHPSTVAASVVIAADWQGVATTEQLARECAAKFGRNSNRVVWRTVERDAYLQAASVRAREWAEKFLRDDPLFTDVSGIAASILLHACGRPEPRTYTALGSYAGMGTIPCISAIVSAGYALDDINRENGIRIVCPLLEAMR